MKLSQSAGILILLGLVAACSREEILPGLREDLRSPNPQAVLGEDGEPVQVADVSAEAQPDENTNKSLPIALPGMVNHASWTHRAGSPQHRVQHPTLSARPTLIWSSSVGQGNDRKHRITAEPVVADGRIYTLDSRALVAAHSTAGAALWTRDLTPPSDKADDASGGGLAYSGGKLFVTSGFGIVSALNPADGAVIWTQKLEAPVSGAPSAVDGVVYVATRDNRAWAIDATDGKVMWQLFGSPDISGVVGAAAPAITADLAIFPFTSGELLAVSRAAGTPAWNEVVTGERRGRGYSIVTDVTGEPVVAGDMVVAGNPVGRTIATNTSGERLWTAHEGAIGPVWVTGGSVFLISDEAQLVRLDATTGERIWGVPLPYFTKERAKRRKAIFANFGPVLAGGRLWVASSDGLMRGFDPKDGSQSVSVEIPDGAASRPIVVNGVMYVVSIKGELLALR